MQETMLKPKHDGRAKSRWARLGWGDEQRARVELTIGAHGGRPKVAGGERQGGRTYETRLVVGFDSPSMAATAIAMPAM